MAQTSIKIYSPVDGVIRELSDINDIAFSTGSMGNGVAIYPTSNEIYAPVNGIISLLYPTKHFMHIKTEGGFDILLHVGLGTVNLEGEGFECFVSENQEIKKGDKLLTVDFDLIEKKNYEKEVMLILHTQKNKAYVKNIVKAGIMVKNGSNVFDATYR